MKATIALLLLLHSANTVAFCDNVRLQINGVSKHTGGSVEVNYGNGERKRHSAKYNETNEGAGVICDSGNGVSYMMGTYRNSFFRETIYAGVNKHWLLAGKSKGWHVEAGGSVVIATGYSEGVSKRNVVDAPDDFEAYKEHNSPVIPLAGITVALAYGNKAKLVLLHLPNSVVSKNSADVTALNLEVSPINW